ncbi:cytochrome d ubiquinol oxidase subunit II [Patulibacter defluvii]|uniref:cytochrome d ubiquinol oxidase subunit II n=1 Tax=Patulibacter defluvii TaxID=3095358 RepID=UPI002A749EE8|nr:cytochrome d ubiquinol oxidase subunit II [Patulibacter sp. DM4]
MDLPTVWFLLIALLWTGYLVLEGFDFGVGMLLPFVARDADDRRLAIRTFGPVWDANEVWLIVAGGAMFAAFPDWYASMFSAMYLPLLLLLVALIVRVLAIEYRVKHQDDRWTRAWDRALVVCSFVAPAAVALALANVVRGIPLNGDHDFTGDLLDLLNPYALLAAAAVLALFALHGACFLALRCDGPVRLRARRVALVAWPLAVVLGGGFGLWSLLDASPDGSVSPVAVVGLVVAAGALVGAGLAIRRGREGGAFALTAAAVIGVAVLLFAQLWPNVLPSTGDPAGTLTIADAASTPYTLKVMTIVGAVMTPIVLLYQGWTYWIFRHRVLPDGFEQAQNPLQALAERRAAES